MAQIELSKIVKSFGAVDVLKGIDISVRDKEFLVLVGPSGCGKSTLLRMIAGLESISGGDISIDGDVVNKIGPQDRDLAMVFQSYALYPHMTAEENMAFSLKLQRRPRSEIQDSVQKAADVLHLQSLLHRYPKHLSGGQRQRVAMGRAIVRDPRAFLFDEPLSNLDAKLRAHMRIEIRQLHNRLEATSVYVTHDQVEAMTMADRIVVMNQGRIEQVGTPLELFDEPANLFVAGFLGAPTMNFAEGEVFLGDDGKHHFLLDQIKGVTAFTVPKHDKVPSRAVLGVRPQHVFVAGPNEKGTILAEIQAIEQTGCETNIVVAFNDVEWTIQSRDRVIASVGDAIHLRLGIDRIHLFDKSSGQRVQITQMGS